MSVAGSEGDGEESLSVCGGGVTLKVVWLNVCRDVATLENVNNTIWRHQCVLLNSEKSGEKGRIEDTGDSSKK